MAKSERKKTVVSGKKAKDDFRIVKESPATTKISKSDIEKAISLTSK